MSETSTAYVGGELAIFARAGHWKQYVERQVRSFLGRRVLEIGAGIGGMTRFLNSGQADEWVCVEPDPDLLAELSSAVKAEELPANCRSVCGTLADVHDARPFDSILYMDVLEHISDDAAELRNAYACLSPGGHLIVLAPAHMWLFSEFDNAVGHFRRYTKCSIQLVAPDESRPVCLRYLDSAGMFASIANRFFMRQSLPSVGQVAFWDGCLVPISVWTDMLSAYSIGKSVLAVWKKV